jgi:glycosyltransferase involved in cell wall biosynthesis
LRLLVLAYRDPSNPFNGGGDVYINELAKGYASRGHSVTFFASRSKGSQSTDKIDNLNIVRLGNKFTMFVHLFFHYFKHFRGQFDLIVEEIIGGPRIPFFASFYMNEPIIGIIQQKHKELFRKQFSLPFYLFFSLLERSLVLFYREKQIIVNSARTLEDLRSLGYDNKKMHIIYPGLPENYFNIPIESYVERSRNLLKIICLTKFRRYKNIHLVIEAVKKVHNSIPNCELIIAGKTNEVEPEYELELRKQVGSLPYIAIEKDITESRKLELLRSSLVLVLPSTLEGFGIVVIEANACGTPAVTSDKVPAAVNGKNAIVTVSNNVDELTTAIIELLTNKEKWLLLSKGSSEWARHFTWNNSADQFTALLNAIYTEQAGVNC